MHATLEARGKQIMASDMPPGMPFDGYKGFSLSVQAKDVKEGEQLFKALSAGGKVTMPYARHLLVAGLRHAGRQVRRAVDGQRRASRTS